MIGSFRFGRRRFETGAGSVAWLAAAAMAVAVPASGNEAVSLPRVTPVTDLPQPQSPVAVAAVAASPTADYWVAGGYRQLRFIAAGSPLFRRRGYRPVAAADLLAHYEFEDGGVPTTTGPRGKAFLTQADCPDQQLLEALMRRRRPLDRYTLAVWLFIAERGGVLYGDNSRQIVLKPGREACQVQLIIRDGRQAHPTGVVGAVPLGVWAHLTLTVDRNRVTCFLNGKQIGEGTVEGLASAVLKPGNIGGIFGNAGSRLYGKSALDDLRWYGRVLTAEEIAAIVAETATPFEVQGGLPFAGATLHDLRFSRDGGLLIAAGGRGADSGVVQVYDLAAGRLRQTFEGYEDVFLTADVSADERFLAVGGPTKVVTIADFGSAEKRHEITNHTDWVTSVAFSPDGRLLASGDRSGGLFVWEAETGAIVFGLPGHKAAVSCLVWSADGTRLTSASEDGQLIAWNMQDGFKLQEATAHEKKVLDRWSHYTGVTAAGLVQAVGKPSLFTAGRDRCIRLWGETLEPQEEMCDLGFLPTAAAASRDGRWIFTGSPDGRLRVIDLRSQRVGDVVPAED